MSKLNIAVIGCGYWGPNLVRNFSKIEGCKVKYVCDLKYQRLKWIKSLYPFVNITRDYKDILKDYSVDAVAIATPVSSHFSLSKKFLLSGRHILVEKPLSKSAKEAKELIEIATEAKKVLMVSHTYLYSSGIRKMKEIISKNQLGKVIYINSVRVNLGLFQKDINVVMDLGPHDVSILNFILQRKPQYISCTGVSHYTKGIEDVAFMNLYYSDNLIAHVHLSWIDPIKIRKITVVGTKKMAIYNDLDIDEPLKILNKSVKKIPYYKSYGEFKMLYKFGDIFSPHISFEEPLLVECRHFVECILKNKKPLTSGEQGLEVVNILQLANKSLKKQGRMLRVK